jgi:predicted DNA-binding transcriptional regulator YafY
MLSRLPSIHLRLAPGVAPAVRPVRWAEPPLLLRRASGAVEIIGVSGDLAGLARYVLGFGVHAEAVGPEALRQRVAREARDVARVYASSSLLPRKARDTFFCCCPLCGRC